LKSFVFVSDIETGMQLRLGICSVKLLAAHVGGLFI